MSQTTTATLAQDALPSRGLDAAAYAELGKPGIVRMVAITAMVGYFLSVVDEGLGLWALLIGAVSTLVGVSLSATGANALNQVMEADRDGRMVRTRARPIPSGRVSAWAGAVFGVVTIVLGAAILLVTGVAPAVLALVTCVTYLGLYTPSKPLTPASTVIGAVPGALPPLIGWSAGAGEASWASLAQLGGWTMFALMFVWQVPHFLAIAWQHRTDYARGGHKVLPVVDHPDGRRTWRWVLIWSAVLVPVSLAPAWAMRDVLTPVSAAAGALGAAGMLWVAVRSARERHDRAARRLFFASIIYLPAVLGVFVLDAVVRAVVS